MLEKEWRKNVASVSPFLGFLIGSEVVLAQQYPAQAITLLFPSLSGILPGAAVIIAAVRLRLGTSTEPRAEFFPFMAGMILIVL